MPTTLRAKCVIVGDSTVGKSALTQVFHSDNAQFPKNYTMTVGIEMCTKSVTIPDVHAHVELFLLDCAGKEIFYEAAQKHWDHPSMVMVVYDVTNDTSFSSCEKWLERVRSQKPGVPFPGVLVANKVDLEERRVVSTQAGQQFAQSKGLAYFECSAKTMQNVDQPFIHLANAFYKLYQTKIDLFKTTG
jgi:transport family protein 27